MKKEVASYQEETDELQFLPLVNFISSNFNKLELSLILTLISTQKVQKSTSLILSCERKRFKLEILAIHERTKRSLIFDFMCYLVFCICCYSH